MTNPFRRLAEFWLPLRHQRVQILLAALAVLAVLLAADVPRALLLGVPFRLDWWIWIDPVLGVATLLVALGVWLIEAREAWEKSLDQRLYVVFALAGRPVLRCDHAPLFGESDIRNFAQQIGGQMAGSRNLNFSLAIQRFAPTVEWQAGVHFRRWVVVFDLDPRQPAAENEAQQKLLALVGTGRFLHWPDARRPAVDGDAVRSLTDWATLIALPWSPTDRAEASVAHTTNA